MCNRKREDFFGIDQFAGPGVDLALNFEREALPFLDDSIDYVLSSHAMEHVEPVNLPYVLREIFRVCKQEAVVEIWAPYVGADEAFVPGHLIYYGEGLWLQLCQSPGLFLKSGTGGFRWREIRYRLVSGVLESLEKEGLSLAFSLRHLRNVASECGVYLSVQKEREVPANATFPTRKYRYTQDTMIGTL
jgi:hypothetical protein